MAQNFVACFCFLRKNIDMTKLRNARQSRGLKITEAAILVGTNIGNLSRIETGQQYPRPPLARRICKIYKVTLEDIFGDHSRSAA